jgi:hypothetical protein
LEVRKAILAILSLSDRAVDALTRWIDQPRERCEKMSVRITIEPMESKDTGICDCCGRSSRCVWGAAYADSHRVAIYFVHWTLGHIPDQGANIDLILGAWGETATSEHRSALAMEYSLLDTGPSMIVVDAGARSFSRSPLVGNVLRRDQVVGSEVARDAFSIADAILGQDDRVAELLGPWKVGS